MEPVDDSSEASEQKLQPAQVAAAVSMAERIRTNIEEVARC